MFRRFLRSFVSTSPVGVLWDGAAAVAEPAVGGTPTATPAGGTPPAAPVAPVAGTPPAAAAGTQFSYPEDRSAWVPPYRLVEQTTRARTLEGQLTEARAGMTERDRRIAALAGVTTPTPDQAEAQKVKDAFFQMFPEFRAITPEMLTRLTAMMEREGEYHAATEHQWNTLANRTLSSLETKFSETLGVETLTPRQQVTIANAFWAFGQGDPERFRQRYEAQDATLIDEFVKAYTDDMFEPVRRRSLAATTARPRVPGGVPSRPVTTAPPAIDYKNPQAVEDEAVRRMKEAGLLQNR